MAGTGLISGFSFFWNATLPQFEAITLSHLGAGARDEAYDVVTQIIFTTLARMFKWTSVPRSVSATAPTAS